MTPSSKGERGTSFTTLRDYFGFVPRFFRERAVTPRIVDAEIALGNAILFRRNELSQVAKERILLVQAAARGDLYWTSLHHQMLTVLGVAEEDLEELVRGTATHEIRSFETILVEAWSAYVRTFSEALQLAPDFPPGPAAGFDLPTHPPLDLPASSLPWDFAPFQQLERHIGFVPRVFQAQSSQPDVIEAEVELLNAIRFAGGEVDPLADAAIVNFLDSLQQNLGSEPDFIQPAKSLHLSPSPARLTQEIPQSDPDRELVARVQAGEVDVFEELVNRHTRRIYRTLMGILGNHEEACDAVQETFLKAYRYLPSFAGRSKFSTWLVSIAHNTGLELLRSRKPVQSLDAPELESEENFRPREIRAWTDNPEQAYSKSEIHRLVESCMMRLPAKYREVLVLRDLEHLSTEETAKILGLGLPTMKSRLLRGRLMLREALTPHFAGAAKGGAA